MALSEIDRSLLERCLAEKPRAWEGFVDRFMGLIMHVINHTAQCRSILLSAAEREDLAADVMLAIVDNDFAVLRGFRGKSSLATYLTVISRRVVVRKLLEKRSATSLGAVAENVLATESEVEQRFTNEEEVERLLAHLEEPESQIVRMYHLEGRTYQEISRITGVATNSVGPMLSRVRARLRSQPKA
ncbi:MAG: sigma-70 family RNA polymerase sigma factor [Pirellulales bacterium]|nr:sigma-70 family RNA polymerase sigma factor [Pirellulales bacterium]